MMAACWTGPGILRRCYVPLGLQARGPVAASGGHSGERRPIVATSAHPLAAYYNELAALEVAISSDLALGQAFEEVLEHLDISEGFEMRPLAWRGPSLAEAFSQVVDEQDEDYLRQASENLLTARLIRAITPDVVERSAGYFERLAAAKMQKALEADA